MKMHDPNSNRMFREDMGTTNSGCKCQTRWIFYWEDGEVVDKELILDNPCFLCDLKEMEKYWQEVEDDMFVHKDDNWMQLWNENNPFYVETTTVNGIRCYKEPCDSVAENMWCYYEDIGKEYLANKPNGMYILDIEFACYECNTWEYTEYT